MRFMEEIIKQNNKDKENKIFNNFINNLINEEDEKEIPGELSKKELN